MGAKSGKKAQSAMEYLMTYGWAILIIAVVLAALYSLGLFNSAAWGPRASSGSCKVFTDHRSYYAGGRVQQRDPTIRCSV